MPNPTIQRLLNKTGYPDLLQKLTHELSGSELNSLLLEIRYYQRLRFSLNLAYKDNEYNIGDGGFVDWDKS